MGLFDKVQNSSKGCVGILSALLNGYQEPEPEPAPEPEPELGSEQEPEQCSNVYVYVDYRIFGNDIQYPDEKTIYRSIPSTETTNEAIVKAKKLLNTKINDKKVVAFVLLLPQDDRRIYLKYNYDKIEQNRAIYNTIVYTFDNISLPE